MHYFSIVDRNQRKEEKYLVVANAKLDFQFTLWTVNTIRKVMKKSHHFLGGNFVVNCRIVFVRSALCLISRSEFEKCS